MIHILNLENNVINEDKKSEIINLVDFNEFNILNYEKELWFQIVLNKKINNSWQNLVLYFERNGLDENLLNLLNYTPWLKKLVDYTKDSSIEISKESVIEFLINLTRFKIDSAALKIIFKRSGINFHGNLILSDSLKSNLAVLIESKFFSTSKISEVYSQLKEHFGKENLHLEFCLKYEKEFLFLPDKTTVLYGLTENELVFIARKNFSRDFFYLAFGSKTVFKGLNFNSSDAIIIVKKIKKYNYLSSTELLVKLLGALPAQEQVEFFCWLFEEKVIEKSTLSAYLIQLAGSLKGIEKPLVKKYNIDNNFTNKRFSEILEHLGIINNYKVGRQEIYFFRNQTDV